MNGGKARKAGPKLSNEIVPPGQAYGAQSHRILLKDIQVKCTSLNLIFFFFKGRGKEFQETLQEMVAFYIERSSVVLEASAQSRPGGEGWYHIKGKRLGHPKGLLSKRQYQDSDSAEGLQVHGKQT